MSGRDSDPRSTELVPLPPGLQVKRFRLLGASEAETDVDFVSQGARVVIGTAEGCELRLAHPTVSRYHCEITVRDEDGRVDVRDLGSKNGTLVDGVLVREASLHDGAVLTLGRAVLRFEVRSDKVAVPVSERSEFGLMVGQSLAARRAFALLEKAAASDATVLLTGETGTGKEAAAESVHLESERRESPFVIVDCGAIPPDLLESELFGHEKGAFTGAASARRGAFAEAAGGTVFLDEIGELSIDLQPKLLRVLERRHVKRVGGARYESVDVRVIAATNRNLRTEVNAGRFRSDLYYRLAVIEIDLPPLRHRPEDLLIIVDRVLHNLDASDRADFIRSASFLQRLRSHDWPGNVRELRNYLERCLAMGEATPIQRHDAADLTGGRPDSSLPLKEAREQWNRLMEEQYVTDLLQRHDGNVSAAARAAGVGRVYFYRLLWKFGLR